MSPTNDENDVELNGETDDEDMEDGEMGFDDGSAQVRNIRDSGQPTVKEHQEHRPYRSWCKFCVMGRAARFIDQLGHNTVTLRCDNEPAIEALAREIGQARQEGSQTVPERPPVVESQSHGIIERAVGLVAGQARTLKAALEHRIGTRIPLDARILCWLIEFAAYVMNRCVIGSDGKTPLQRLHGRRDNTPLLEFGEKILYMPAKPARG